MDIFIYLKAWRADCQIHTVVLANCEYGWLALMHIYLSNCILSVLQIIGTWDTDSHLENSQETEEDIVEHQLPRVQWGA